MSKLLNYNEIENLEIKKTQSRCRLCPNNCELNIHSFDKRRFITGNRCNKPLIKKNNSSENNLVEYKYNRLFDYSPKINTNREKIGIPRILNMYQHYPFWFTLFTELEYEVIISDRSSKKYMNQLWKQFLQKHCVIQLN